MEEYLITAVDYLRLVVEAIGAAVVGFGVIATAVRFVLTLLGIRDYSNTQIRLFLGHYLALGLDPDAEYERIRKKWPEMDL